MTIDSDAMQTTRVTATTTRGTWWAGELQPGTYHITFAHAGTQSVTRVAQVRLGETVRVDAELQPSEEGESVTVTTLTRSLLERPDAVTQSDTATIEETPLARELSRRIVVAPGVAHGSIRRSTDNFWIVDGALSTRHRDVEVEDAIADVAVITTAADAEYGRFTGGTIVATTQSGGNEFSGSLRDTVTSGRWVAGGSGSDFDSRLEGTVGGRIVRDAIWFFLAGEDGSRVLDGDERSMSAKLTASAGLRDTLVASYLRSSTPDELRGSAFFTHVASSRAVITARFATVHADTSEENDAAAVLRTFLPASNGDHQLSAGAERFARTGSAFLTDSWNDGVRWTLTAGARYDEHLGTSPRAGVSFATGTDGAHLAATWGRYRSENDSADEATLGYTRRLFTSGYARVMLVDRKYDSGIRYRGIEADARGQYLFLTFGATATAGTHTRTATAWVSGTPPALEQHIAIALLERYRGAFATDVSLQYRFTRYALQPFAKVDLLNVFDEALTDNEDPLGARRAMRVAIGMRF